MPVMIPTPAEYRMLPWPQRERAIRNARGFLRYALPTADLPDMPILDVYDPSSAEWPGATREWARRILSTSAEDPMAAVHRGQLRAVINEARK